MSSIGRRHMECSHPGCKAEVGLFHQHWNCELGKSVCRNHVRLCYLEDGMDTVLMKYGIPGINYKADALPVADMEPAEAEAIGRYTAKQGYLRAKPPFKKGSPLWKSWVRGFGGDV